MTDPTPLIVHDRRDDDWTPIEHAITVPADVAPLPDHVANSPILAVVRRILAAPARG